MISRVSTSILAATTLRDDRDAVLHTAAALARSCGAALHVLHVLEPPSALAPRRWLGDGDRQRIDDAEGELQRVVAALQREHAVSVTTHVRPGAPHRAIVDVARDVAPVLIVTGPHRRGAVSTHLFGTTAETIARDADVPTLVVREPLPLPVRRIGVPTDLSGTPAAALRLAVGWRRWVRDRRRAESTSIHYMHVGWPVERHDDPSIEETRVRPHMRRDLDAALGAEAAGAPVEIEVVWADEPVEAITRWAARRRMDLLVVGMHGWRGARRLLIGSDAASLTRGGPCAVLLVPHAYDAPASPEPADAPAPAASGHVDDPTWLRGAAARDAS